MQDVFVLEILTPEKCLFKGDVSKVTMPGVKAPFVILYNHAPIVSVLQKGLLLWSDGDAEHSIEISGGFVEVNKNVVTACVEVK